MSPSPPVDKGSNGDGSGRQLSDRASEYDPFDALDYPCRFEIKAMGRNDNRFNALVQGIVTKHISQEDLLNSKVRPSREGKYVSITVIIRASGKQQIRAIYADLAQCPEVLMTL